MEKLTSCGKLVKTSLSPDQTINLGYNLGQQLKSNKNNLFLWGELGSGKTTFLKGVGKGFGIKQRIISPSFQLVRKYTKKNKDNFIHIDLYRLGSIDEIIHLGWWELLEEKGITAVEWAERAKKLWPEKGLFINFQHIAKDKRKIEFYSTRKLIPGN